MATVHIKFNPETRRFGAVSSFLRRNKRKILLGGAIAAGAALGGSMLYNEVRRPSVDQAKSIHADTLTKEKQRLMSYYGLSESEFSMLAKLSGGITEQESNWGDSLRWRMKEVTPDWVLKAAKAVAGKDTTLSKGYGQVKYDYLDDKTKNNLAEYGVDADNANNFRNSALLTFSKLAEIYVSQVRGKTFTDAKGRTIPPNVAILYLYQGRRRGLLNSEVNPDNNKYIRNVKENEAKQGGMWEPTKESSDGKDSI